MLCLPSSDYDKVVDFDRQGACHVWYSYSLELFGGNLTSVLFMCGVLGFYSPFNNNFISVMCQCVLVSF